MSLETFSLSCLAVGWLFGLAVADCTDNVFIRCIIWILLWAFMFVLSKTVIH